MNSRIQRREASIIYTFERRQSAGIQTDAPAGDWGAYGRWAWGPDRRGRERCVSLRYQIHLRAVGLRRRIGARSRLDDFASHECVARIVRVKAVGREA